jgi:leucyl-tRNA synthetase
MVLHDLGLIDFDNPFKRFRANGMILKDGKKMSKSKGNVLNPEEYGEKIGYDALKTYLLFLGPLSEDRSFTDRGVLGAKRWAEKVYNLRGKARVNFNDSPETLRKLHQTIKRVTVDFEEQKYNTAVARLMELSNHLAILSVFSHDVWKKCLALFAPFLPALSEELWFLADETDSIFSEKNWPEYDPELARDEKIELVLQVNGKVRDRVEVDAEISEVEALKLAKESEQIKKWTQDKKIIKEVFVKGKLVNIVVA